MANKQEILSLVIEPMALLARPVINREEDPNGYARAVNQYVEGLKDFPPPTLRLGMELWRADWTAGIWPVPGRLRIYMCQAERDLGQANPQPRLNRPEELEIPQKDRQRIGKALGNLRQMLKGELGDAKQMMDEQYYDQVCGKMFGPAHRAKMLDRFARNRGI